MDKILINGAIVTMDDHRTEVQAMGIAAGRVAALGSSENVLALATESTEIIELHGATVLPGLIDAHAHLELLAYSLELAVDCRSPKNGSIEDIVAALSESAAAAAPGTWILGQGNHFQDAMLAERRYPDRHDLDRVSDVHPVVYRASFHFKVFNSCAMRLLGITPETPDAPGGRIERDPDTDALTGRIFDMYSEVAEADPVELEAAMVKIAQRYLALGVTAVGDIPMLPNGLTALIRAAHTKSLGVRVVAYPKLPTVATLEDTTNGQLRRRFANLDEDVLTLGGVKLFADGGLTASAAALYEPYATDPTQRGTPTFEPHELNEIVSKLAEAGHQILVHAVGDRAIDMTLDAYESIPDSQRRPHAPHRIEHGGNAFVTDERIKRIQNLNAMAVPQPSFILTTAQGYRRALGEERSRELIPLKRLLDAGLPIPGNSDAMGIRPDQHSPFLAMFAAITRQSSNGEIINPEQAITIDDALLMYTRNAALALGKATEIGSLELNKHADFAIFHNDPRKTEAHDLLTIRAHQTWVGGELAHHEPSQNITTPNTRETDANRGPSPATLQREDAPSAARQP